MKHVEGYVAGIVYAAGYVCEHYKEDSLPLARELLAWVGIETLNDLVEADAGAHDKQLAQRALQS